MVKRKGFISMIIPTDDASTLKIEESEEGKIMQQTKRKPVTVGVMLVEEFLDPLGLTQTELAQRSGLPRKHVNELCRDRRAVTADTALILARVFGNSADFWLNTQRRTDLWEALNTPQRAQRITRAQPLETRTRRSKAA